MDLVEAVKSAWGWCGIDPVEIVDVNLFGNLLVKTREGNYWRICPEELSATRVANSESELRSVTAAPEFAEDWNMFVLVEQAKSKLGQVGDGRCYCLKIPGVLGGAYDADNFGTISIGELASASGDMARQIADMPDGAKVKLVIKSEP